MKLFQLILAGAVLAAPAVQAQTVFDFANLTDGNTSNFLPTGGTGVYCTGGDRCSSSNGNALTFAKGSITVDTTGWYKNGSTWTAARVVQDHEDGYNGVQTGSTAKGAGLGVYHLPNSDPDINADDNITENEMLKLHFNQVVSISAIGLRSDGHNTTNWSDDAQFKYSFDNSTWQTAALPKDVGQVSLTHTGQDLYLQYTGSSNKNSHFYLSSMTVAAVPEPETYAMLMAGLGVIGFMSRRRKARKA
jgi:hypothetical protein